MAQSPLNLGRQDEPAEFNLREWALKARTISRENTKSRRFSSSYITSFREDDSKSFRSNTNISSTASSPGHNLIRGEIDPSTYSFSSALRALQARSVNTWEGLSLEGFALNSKWNEAEKYICNPVSGEVPMECLSAKTLGGKSFRNVTSRITMSAPLIYPSHSRFIQATPTYNDEAQFQNIIKEKKVANMFTRGVGVGSKLPDLISTPASSPQLGENCPMSNAAAAAAEPKSTPKLKSEEDKGEMKERDDDGKEETESEEEEETRKTEAGEKQVHHNNNNMRKCRGGKIGCLSLRSLWMTRKSDKHKSRNKMKKKKKNIFPLPCYNYNNNNNNNNNSGC